MINNFNRHEEQHLYQWIKDSTTIISRLPNQIPAETDSDLNYDSFEIFRPSSFSSFIIWSRGICILVEESIDHLHLVSMLRRVKSLSS